MKKIAITGRLDLNASYYEVREGLDINWSLILGRLGFLPILLPNEISPDRYFKEVEFDGVLLTGGNDLASLNDDLLSKKRDEHEFKIISYAINNHIPIFGVCRGMQVIAQYFNSTFRELKGHVAIEHSLLVNDSSKYSQQLHALGSVNAYHKYSVESVTNEILISATDKNGVIKAIEHTKLPIFGQMWHPERFSPSSIEEILLIESFFEK